MEANNMTVGDNIKKQYQAILSGRLIICMALLLCTVLAYAQEQNVGFPRQTLSRREAMTEIQKQTGYHFAVNHNTFDDMGKVTFTRQTLPLSVALNQLLVATGHTYVINGRQILITKEDCPPEEKKTPTPEKTPPVVSRAPVYTPPVQVPYRDDEFEQSLRQFNKVEKAPKPTEKTTITHTTQTSKREVTRRQGHVYNSGVVKHPPMVIELVNTKNQLSLDNLAYHRVPSRFAVKTNLLYGVAALTPNLGIEMALSRKSTLEIAAAWNPFNKNGKGENNQKLVHFAIKPEFRYWLCERFNGHFFGIHPFYMQYNVSHRKVPLLFEKAYRYEGTAFGAGISYGYHWMLGKHWGLEFTAGFGGAFLKYDKYPHDKCADAIGKFDKKYFGPTSLGIKLMYIIK